jgi:hypothetical protein
MAIFDRGMVPARTTAMRLVLLVLALLLAGSPAVADPRQDTDRAMAELRTAEQSLRNAAAVRATLGSRYEEELRTIDKLKKQRGSWRRDRQLRDSLAASLETAKKLEVATAEQKRAEARQLQAKQRTLTAVAAELRTPPADPARLATLTRERGRLAPTTRAAPAAAKKIILPDLEIDPLADPEELEQQAAAIRESERALAVQVAVLDQRATRLGKASELRKQHARAGDLSEREEGQTRRGTFRENDRFGGEDSADGGGPEAPAPGNGSGDGGGSIPPPPSPEPAAPPPPPLELAPTVSDAVALAESSTVLGDVIDAASIESLRKAQGSADPVVRAAAARKARDAAAAKLELLRKHRAAIEARARGLRGPSKK